MIQHQQHQRHDHHGDPTLPCGGCRKRHARGSDSTATVRRGGKTTPRGMSLRPSRRAMASIAILALVATSTASGPAPAAVAAAAGNSLPIGGVGVSLRSSLAKLVDVDVTQDVGGHQLKISRRLEAAATEKDHDHDAHDHDDHEDAELAMDLDAAMAAALFSGGSDSHQDEHADHDHSAHDHSAHDGHGDHDSHDDHEDHDDHEGHDHGSHEGHDHGEEEFSSFSSSENEAQKLPWGEVIGATLLVNLAALSGVLIVLMAAIHRGLLKARGQEATDTVVGHGLLFDICIPAFAVGALIATAVFLIFPEALHLIEGGHGVGGHDDHSEEGDAHDDHSGHGHRYLQEDTSHAEHDDSSESVNAAKFGCAILGGFLLPFLFSILFHSNETPGGHNHDSDDSVPDRDDLCASCKADSTEMGVSVTANENEISDTLIVQKVEEDSNGDVDPINEVEEGVRVSRAPETLPTKTFIDKQLCASILLGDAFHNFADGVFIGAAFKSCSTSVALSIILVTLFHEIAQELADFILLTRYAGLSIIKACVLNFISGLSVCLGGIVFLAGDPSDEATGIILAMAGGVYFNIAGCETVPRLETVVKSRIDRVWVLFSVIIGTIPIGLILLNHQHCG